MVFQFNKSQRASVLCFFLFACFVVKPVNASSFTIAPQGSDELKKLIAGEIFLARKPGATSSGAEDDRGQKVLFTQVGPNRKFMVVSISTVPEISMFASSGEGRVTWRPSALLFDLEKGKVVKHYRNAGLGIQENTLVLTRYNDALWGRTFTLSEFKTLEKGETYEYLDPETFEKREAPKRRKSLPGGHRVSPQIAKTDEYVVTFTEADRSKTFLWRESPEGWESAGEFPVKAGRISADGTMLSGAREGDIEIYDIRSERLVKKVEVAKKGTLSAGNRTTETAQSAYIDKRGRLIYAFVSVSLPTGGSQSRELSLSSGVSVLDLDTERELASFPRAGIQFVVVDEGDTLLTVSMTEGTLTFIDLSSNSIISRQAYAVTGQSEPFTQLATMTPIDDRYSLISNPSGVVSLVDLKARDIAADIYVDHEDWAVVARDGRVDGTPGSLEKLEWHEYGSDGNIANRTSLDAAFDSFFTPRLLLSLLRGDEGDVDKLQQQLARSPVVELINPEDGTRVSEKEIPVTVRATPNGDPVDQIEIFVNGKLIAGKGRGMSVVGRGDERTIKVALTSGTNIIGARAVSRNGYESDLAESMVEYVGQRAASDLYIVSVGIDEYRNPSYNLNYARTDARAFVDEVESRAGSIFGRINTYRVTDGQAVKDNLMETIATVREEAQPQDMFMFFYAGHGVMGGGANGAEDFYLALHDVTQLYGSDQMLADRGISASELREMLGNIQARKQLVVLDACQSGGAVETFAMRGVAEEKAIIQLARSTGTTLLASTGTEQFATEFEQLGHGVFTYSILDGLRGAADGGADDGKITVKELEAYLNDMVPELTQRYKGTVQYPRSWSRGMDFPLVVVD